MTVVIGQNNYFGFGFTHSKENRSKPQLPHLWFGTAMGV